MHLKNTRIEKNLLQLFATLTLLVCSLAGSAQARFNTVVNETHPGLQDYVQVEYTIENAKSVEKIEPPAFKNFRIIQGPIQSNGMSIMNGVLSQYKSLTYILQPVSTGRLIIPGTIAVIDGKSVQSQAVAIEVTRKGNGNSGNSGNGNSLMPSMPAFPQDEPEVEEEYRLRPGESILEKIKKNIFVRADVNKTSCYEGEPIVATFELCSRLRSESKVLKRPSLNGFSVLDMIEPESNRPTVQIINGKAFNVHVIRKTQLFPLQAGNFEIDPVELENTVKFIKPGTDGNSSRSPMQQFMDEFMSGRANGEVVEQSFNLGSKPIAITVKPLPLANKPEGFNGAVGKFSLQVDGKQKTVAAGEAVSLKVAIRGQGNFNMINALTLQFPDHMEVYDPVIKEAVDKTIYPLSGSKTFTYTFIAKDTGNFIIPAISFSYFDPADALYKTETSDSFKIQVTPALKKKGLIGKIFRPAADASPVHWLDAISVNMLISILALIFVGGLALFQWSKSRRTQRPPPIPVATASAPLKVQHTQPEYSLINAKRAMEDGQSQLFYSEVNNTIWKELKDRVHIPSTELNKYNVVTQLELKGASPVLTRQLKEVLQECEIALYTPVHSITDMQETLDKAEILIKDFRRTFV